MFNNVTALLNSQPGRANRTLKAMGARPGEDTDSTTFQLPEFTDTNMSADQIADVIADHFASISSEFQPVSLARLPQDVRQEIENYTIDQVPVIEEDMVSDIINSVKKSRRPTSGDIPPFLFKQALQIIKKPITQLFNKVATTGKWPHRWNIEHAFPL